MEKRMLYKSPECDSIKIEAPRIMETSVEFGEGGGGWNPDEEDLDG